MFRACLAQNSRLILSPAPQCSSSFYTCASLNAQASRKSVARGVKKVNNVKKAERWKRAEASRPSVVLGTRPGDESKWENCDLAKVLVNVNELASSTELEPSRHPVGTIHLPKQISFGIGEVEKKMLFTDLPMLSAEASFPAHDLRNPQVTFSRGADIQAKELRKANAFAKLVDLRNANAGGIAYENRRRIISAFSTPENPFDPGRSEVQAALLTFQIRNLWTHLTTFRRDIGNRRGLRKLVHQRAKVLRYLKRLDQDRYESVLERLALEPESVEGELVV